MNKQVRALLIAIGVVVAAVVPGGLVIPAAIGAFLAFRRRKSQPAAPQEQ